ncbi:MAG: BPSS1780 family membrane protein [Gammaproteobacteria bacterium]
MTESNPFQTPESDVTAKQINSQTNALNNNVTCHTVPMQNGAIWVIDGFRNFMISPFTWSLVVFLYLAMLGTLSMLPFVSIISSIIAPIFLAGLMLCARENKEQQTFQVKQLFQGFSLNGGKLAGLGALNLGVMIVLFMIIGIIAVVILLGNIGSVENFITMLENNSFSQNDALQFILVILIATLFIIPITMAFWFAPALVIFHDVDIFASLKLSFMGCLKNVMPYLIYSLVYLLVYVIAAIPIFILISFIGDTGIESNPLILLLMILVGTAELFILASLFFTSVYASYEDIFLTE